MALSLATVGGKITATFTNLIIAVVNRQQGTGVNPTSLAGTGSNSIGAAGRVNVSASTALRINGFASAAYTRYEIIYDLDFTGTVTSSNIVFASGGTDTATNYASQFNKQVSTTTTGLAAAAGASIPFTDAATVHAFGRITLYQPFAAHVTGFDVIGTMMTTTTSTVQTRCDGQQNSTTSFDGMTFTIVGGGTMTGTIQIFGINDN